MRKKELDPKTKKRNRILALILAVVILGIMAYTVYSMYTGDIEQLEDTSIYGTEKRMGE